VRRSFVWFAARVGSGAGIVMALAELLTEIRSDCTWWIAGCDAVLCNGLFLERGLHIAGDEGGEG